MATVVVTSMSTSKCQIVFFENFRWYGKVVRSGINGMEWYIEYDTIRVTG